jgi:hypothetical protein
MDDLSQEPVIGPGQILDLDDQLGPDLMIARCEKS